MISTLYFTGMAIGALVWGLISDRFGRKPTLLLCLYVQGVIGLSLGIIYDMEWFIVLRFLQGFFVQVNESLSIFPHNLSHTFTGSANISLHSSNGILFPY